MKLTPLKYTLYFTFIFFLGDVVGQERFNPTDYDLFDESSSGGSFDFVEFILFLPEAFLGIAFALAVWWFMCYVLPDIAFFIIKYLRICSFFIIKHQKTLARIVVIIAVIVIVNFFAQFNR